MLKKGFTLIELLAVIVILALIAILTSTAITKLVKDSKKDLSNTQIKLIKSAAETWGADNMMSLPEKDRCSYLLLSDLKNEGLLDSTILDANTNKEIPDDLKIKITTTSGEYGNLITSYEVNPSDVENCKWIYDKSEPDKPQYVDSSGASVPDLMDNTLVPVVYDVDHWEIADASEEWYDYNNQWWANAVILDDSVSKKPGTEIYPDGDKTNIKAMFVWIPRYEYHIEGQYGKNGTSSGLPGEIEVNFISKDKTTATQGYIIHPAFTFGEDDLSGIWVGKFETSHTTLSSSTTMQQLACTNNECANADGLRVLPNVQSLRYNRISSFFYASRSMSRSGNSFGINKEITNTHMMKNSEWGAVAYLSQSKYGKYGNSDYAEYRKEIYINNSSNYYTGRSSGYIPYSETSEEGKCHYDNLTSQGVGRGSCGGGASTTGNIYGIYDMVGGTSEYVMGYLTTSYKTIWGASLDGYDKEVDYAKFTSQPNPKYFDGYDDTDESNEKYNGHALGETNNWYGDYSLFAYTLHPWFVRGSSYNSHTGGGVFYSGSDNGNGASSFSFRIVFAPASGID